jgi:hypothetical protein
MTTEQIKECKDVTVLELRLLAKDIRKVERRLVKRAIKRLQNGSSVPKFTVS